jgi:branched-subunit amino acid aminotransferase/4-amino-4-deoxychorismate lyase
LNSLKIHLPPSDDFPDGKGIFETFSAVNGVPALFEEHWTRLKNSCRELNYPIDVNPSEIIKVIQNGISGLGRKKIRLTYCPDSEFFIQILEAKSLPREWKLTLSVVEPAPLAAYKTTNRKHYEELWEKAVQNNFHDALMVSRDGKILETTRANFFIFAHRKLITPPANGKILPGIARSKVIQYSSQLGIPVEEREITLEEALAADGFFATNSLIGIMPVQRIGEIQKEKICPQIKELKANINPVLICSPICTNKSEQPRR